MTNYAYGWDYSWYNPSDSTLTSNSVQFVCRYLSYDTTGKNIDASEYTHLHSLGISVVLNWEYNTQAPKSGYSQGVSDATKAESLRQSIGAPANAPIYFSVDFDASPGDQTAIDQYLAGAASVIGHARVGVYGSYYVVERCYASGSASWFWQTYAWSGGSISSHAHIHQFNNGIQSGNADEDHALKPSYGQIKPDGTVGTPTTGAFSMSATAHMSVSTGAPPPPVDPPPTVTVKDRPFLLADPRTIKLLVAGPDYRPLAPLTTWSSIEATPTLRDNGVGTLVIPADERIYNLLTGTGNRLHLYYQGRTWLCGPITTVEQPEEGGVPGQLTCTWVSDMTWLGRRLTYPSPSKESTDTTQPANYTATDIAETVLRNLVDLNIGPGALPARQKSGLVLETAHSPLLGSSVSVTAPMSQTLKDSLAAAAVASTPNLGFDLVLDDAVPQLVFRVWAPVDRSNRVRYTRGLNNVTSADVTSTMPTATVAIVGAEATTVTTDTSTEDTTEKPGKVWERSADADTLTAWGRQEVWVSSSADSEATQAAQDSQSQQDGDLAVLNGSYSVTVDAQVIDTPGRQYGVDYQLGDTVGYNPPLGEPITQVVQSVTLHAEPQTGVTVIPNFGDATPRMGKDLIGLVQQLQRRIARLEAG